MPVFWNAIINCGEENVFTCCPIVVNIFACLQSWTSLGTLCISRAFSNSHRSNPSPHPANNVGRVYPELFSSIGCGGVCLNVAGRDSRVEVAGAGAGAGAGKGRG